jgi:nucleoside-triphosphatase
MATSHILFLTGLPGVGKTTVIRRVATALGDWHLSGFTTEEIRQDGSRQGFLLKTFDGRQEVLAHVSISKSQRVGRYGVRTETMDAVSESCLTPRDDADAYLVDEVGRMECLSARFVAALRTLLASEHLVVATVAKRGSGLIAEVKRWPHAELWEVSKANRDGLPNRVMRWLENRRSGSPGPL